MNSRISPFIRLQFWAFENALAAIAMSKCAAKHLAEGLRFPKRTLCFHNALHGYIAVRFGENFIGF
jgi:hypothetical protein